MNLLPKVNSEFGDKTYWDRFFNRRGTQAFEWYGDYQFLKYILHKYIKLSDEVLVAGCGNSKLSLDLYDVGYTNICNVDISESIIKLMKKKNSRDRPKMNWETMDITNMTFEDEKFNVVLDKGTLDALMTDDSVEVCLKVEKMFKEINRVLKLGGRYVCISLLQSHILKFILKWFRNEGWLTRIHICQDDSSQLETNKPNSLFPVFAVVCTKLKKMANVPSILEFCLPDGKSNRLQNEEEATSCVNGYQQFAFVRHQLSKGDSLDDSSCLELHSPGSDTPRYFLFIVNTKQKSSTVPFAIFIVPKGRESEWLYGNGEGRKYLAENTKCRTMIVVHLNRDHEYKNLSDVKDELSSKIMELAPANLPPNYQVPFWSTGDDLGERVIREQGISEISKEFVVEDVEVDGSKFRRLIFLSNRNVIQSEAKLKSVSNKKDLIADLNFLSCDHHSYMIAGLAFLPKLILEKQTTRILIIGLGGGALPMFVHRSFPKMEIDVVDIDPKIVDVAKKWFGFTPDRKMSVHVTDGIEFIEKISQSGEKYAVVMFDVDGKDSSVGMSCPPQAFVSEKILELVKLILNPDIGLLILNLVCRQVELKKSVTNRLKGIFKVVYSLQLEEDVNNIIYCLPHCVKDKPKMDSHLSETLRVVSKHLNKSAGEHKWDKEQMLTQLKLL